MTVHWLEQTEAGVPADDDWLSANEVICLKGLRFAKRRTDWRLGRWTAKRALAAYLDLPAHPGVLAKIDIRAASSGAPEAFVDCKPAPATISLSHRAGRAACAVAASAVELGCDLEVVEPRSPGFLFDYFTPEEQAQVARAPAAGQVRLVTLLWSGKESALKALRTGLRLDTRSVVVCPEESALDINGWTSLQVRCTGGRIFHGWWRQVDDILCTVVAGSAPDPPISLVIPAYFPDRVAEYA